MPMQSESNASQRVLPVLAKLESRGDGTFILKPQVVESDTDTWLTPRQAAKVLGNLHTKSVYKLLGKYLVFRRPLPRKILVSLHSALLFKQATMNEDFWDDPYLRKQVIEQVQAEMQRQTEESACRRIVAVKSKVARATSLRQSRPPS